MTKRKSDNAITKTTMVAATAATE